MRKITIVGSILLPAALFAQAPAPAPAPQAPAPAAQAPKETSAAAASAGAGRVAVVDFQKAVVENAEGKKAQERFMAEVNKRQKDFEGKQKSLTDAQNKLQTQAQVLTDTVKADLNRQIDKLNTELQRMNDDAKKISAIFSSNFSGRLWSRRKRFCRRIRRRTALPSFLMFRARPTASSTSRMLPTSRQRSSAASMLPLPKRLPPHPPQRRNRQNLPKNR